VVVGGKTNHAWSLVGPVVSVHVTCDDMDGALPQAREQQRDVEMYRMCVCT
jgi:hypothetical protein